VAQEESEAKLRFDKQIAKLKHQYVPALLLSVLKFICFRIKFSEGQLKNTQSRLDRLEETTKSQTAELERLRSNHTTVETELKELEQAVKASQQSLSALNAVLEERNNALELAKRAAIRASKENDKAQKDISAMVSNFGSS